MLAGTVLILAVLQHGAEGGVHGVLVEFVAAESAGGTNTLTGVVDAVTFRGRFSQVWISVAGVRLLFEEPGDTPIRPQDVIRVSISPEHLLVYEASLK